MEVVAVVAVVEEEAVMAAVAARHLRLVLLQLRVLPLPERHLDSLLHRFGRAHLWTEELRGVNTNCAPFCTALGVRTLRADS